MDIISIIKTNVSQTLENFYQKTVSPQDISINITKPEFTGDYTVVLFPFVKELKLSPDVIGNVLGEALISNPQKLFSHYEIVKGFLNITVAGDYWKIFLIENFNNKNFGTKQPNNKTIVLEYSSPNTNKPLHLGHLRNIFLGWSVSEILKTNGYNVVKTCVVNDRGIHICKSMIAWEKFANGATPQSTGMKGDHFVGDYYVKFSTEVKAEIKTLVQQGLSEAEAEANAPLMLQTRQMLIDWEAGKPDVMELWSKMNSWVYEGFDITYKRIGADFEKVYYESNTYLLGKEIVHEGLADKVLFKKEDGSVWADLTPDGLDEKLVLRKDGTSVYITQDIGLAAEKYKEYPYQESIYVIADEQNYHMKVLQLIGQKLDKPFANGIKHLSYGMVELPSGRMKSREGTVVDADDLIDEMIAQAKEKTAVFGKVQNENFSENELQQLYETIGLGGIKFYLLKVEPRKKMIFNPEESIDLHGVTAAFVQYAYARIKSILKEYAKELSPSATLNEALLPKEKELIFLLSQYPQIVQQAAEEYNPSVVATYAFNVAQLFNSFYSMHKVLKAESEEKKILRLQLIQFTSQILASSMKLLGINVPEKM